MASVDRNTINDVAATTTLLVDPYGGEELFSGRITFVADAWPDYSPPGPSWSQDIDAAYGRGINAGRGLVGEGGDRGTGVVGIAGATLAKGDDKQFPRRITDGQQPGQNARIGVLGIGKAIDLPRGERPRRKTNGVGNAVGVQGESDDSVGVFGKADNGVGVLGRSNSVAVFGDGSDGRIGVQGMSGAQYGVLGQVSTKAPNDDMIGVFGVAGFDEKFSPTIGSAGVFAGRVYVSLGLTVGGDFVVEGLKGAAARHTDGTRRLLYCTESPESQFDDFGEASLVNGKADVRLDRDFAGVADTRHYHVFLTPYGDSRGLYVAARRRNGFQVREQGKGRSRVTFSYRVVAKRRDVKTKRFAKFVKPSVTMPDPVVVVVPDSVSRRRTARAKAKGRTKARPRHPELRRRG
jgi:hypothetical protein